MKSEHPPVDGRRRVTGHGIGTAVPQFAPTGDLDLLEPSEGYVDALRLPPYQMVLVTGAGHQEIEGRRFLMLDLGRMRAQRPAAVNSGRILLMAAIGRRLDRRSAERSAAFELMMKDVAAKPLEDFTAAVRQYRRLSDRTRVLRAAVIAQIQTRRAR